MGYASMLFAIACIAGAIYWFVYRDTITMKICGKQIEFDKADSPSGSYVTMKIEGMDEVLINFNSIAFRDLAFIELKNGKINARIKEKVSAALGLCQAYINGDCTLCEKCNLTWDTNDEEPPTIINKNLGAMKSLLEHYTVITNQLDGLSLPQHNGRKFYREGANEGILTYEITSAGESISYRNQGDTKFYTLSDINTLYEELGIKHV